jgi:hypothetical protein
MFATVALGVLVSTHGAAASLDDVTPSISYTLTGTSGDNGWWRSNVTVHWTVSPTDGLVSTTGCDPALLVSGDVTGATRTCAATWSDPTGDTTISKKTQAINIDKTAPTVSGSPGRAPNAGGWYNAPVTVRFDATDATSGVKPASCTSATYSGPDDSTASVGGSCQDNAGNTGSDSFQLRFDATPPAVSSATPERTPDVAGWYNHPVSFAVTSGGDNLSGVASCPSATYSGPDDATASFGARCVDNAGNVGTKSVSLQYDASGPAVQPVPARPPDRYGWYSHDIRISFVGTDAAAGVASCTEAVYGGPSSATASVTGACTDNAGNTTDRPFAFRYAEPFLTPRSGTRVASPPLLNWPDVPRVRYYNVQVWHNGKVLSRWPVRSRWQLTRTWWFNGSRHRLKPGRYDWYVWPRIGRSYRRMVGHSVFYVGAA